MPLQNFVDKVGPVVSAAWLNAVDGLKFTVFADAATKAAARTALTSDAPLEVVNGGTGSRTGEPSYGISTEETSLSITPTNYHYPYGNVLRYGAVGNGSNNDLTAINNAAKVAAAMKVPLYFNPGYVYGINGYIEVLNGTPEVTGSGRIACLNNGNTAPSGLMLKGTGHGAASNVTDCWVHGLIIDRNGQWSWGIYAENVIDCRITDNAIINGTGVIANNYAAILLPTIDETVAGPTGVIVANNYVECEETTSVVGGADGIQVAGAYSVAPYADITAKWKATYALPTTTQVASRILITGNIVVGGYYGISMVETRYSEITGNICINNIRSISMQSNCTSIKIEGNALQDPNSSAINAGFGATNCTITGNHIYSSRAIGEGLLNSYIGPVNNLWEGNYTYAATLSPQYHIYLGIHATGNTFKNNVFGGLCAKAYIAVESAWDTSVSNPAHKQAGGGTLEDYANAASTANSIEGNTVKGLSAVPAIFLGQINSDATVCALTDTRVVGNTIVGNAHNYQLELYEENAGSLSGVVLKDNVFDSLATAASFTFTQGRSHFSVCEGNIILNKPAVSNPFASFTAADTTPSVAYGDYWQFGNAAPTSVTMFDSGMDGQELIVRGDANTTLVHNTSYLRLKGSVNIAFTSSDHFVTLKRISGIWFEVSRSF